MTVEIIAFTLTTGVLSEMAFDSFPRSRLQSHCYENPAAISPGFGGGFSSRFSNGAGGKLHADG